MNVRHILVPHDFSAHADQALAYAITLGTTLQARVTLLHVIQTSMLAGDPVGAGAGIGVYIEDLEAEARQAIEDRAQQARDAGLECDTVVTLGTPFQDIIDYVNAHAVDLIIMGSHGRTGLLHALLGSVAERTVRLAPCPVMVTRVAESDAT